MFARVRFIFVASLAAHAASGCDLKIETELLALGVRGTPRARNAFARRLRACFPRNGKNVRFRFCEANGLRTHSERIKPRKSAVRTHLTDSIFCFFPQPESADRKAAEDGYFFLLKTSSTTAQIPAIVKGLEMTR